MAARKVHCTVPYFGFKAKLVPVNPSPFRDCTVPYFGFKAKLFSRRVSDNQNCTVPYFGFKAKHTPDNTVVFRIVLCLILDSRQNTKTKRS